MTRAAHARDAFRYVSDPGGNLTVTSPSELQNAELAASQYVEYLQVRAREGVGTNGRIWVHGKH